MNRRQAIKCVAGGVLAARTLSAQQPRVTNPAVTTDLSVFDFGGYNVLTFRRRFRTGTCTAVNPCDGYVLVGSGAPNAAAQIKERINVSLRGNPKVEVVFNTHYHADQTGDNDVFAADGAKIVAHEHTRQWMSTDHWVPDLEVYEKARPKAAWPTETFRTTGTLKLENQTIDYGHLPLAHTDGDMYVFFREINVIAVGDVASPRIDPSLDWFTGAWIGGRVDAMDTILKLSNEQTKIVPATGSVMSRAEFKEERDMMEEVRDRIWKHTLLGESPQEMLQAGVMKGLLREWKDPLKFLYDAGKGMFAHHNKLDPGMN
jgi:cyclase